MKISDQEIKKSFSGFRFGEIIDSNINFQKTLLAEKILALDCGYSCGYSVLQILKELKMVSEKTNKPFKEAKKWAFLEIFLYTKGKYLEL